MRRRQRPVLVTGAPISREAEFNARRNRYLLMMGGRLVLLIAAAIIVPYSVTFAVVVGAMSAVLPWLAVVLANDGPPKKSRRYRPADAEHGRALALLPGPLPAQRAIIAGTVVTDDQRVDGPHPSSRGGGTP